MYQVFSKYKSLIFISHWIDQIYGLRELLNHRRTHHSGPREQLREEMIQTETFRKGFFEEEALDVVWRDN